jgi:tetratricopeptide (TPR) repeat protein
MIENPSDSELPSPSPFSKHPFLELVESDPELSALREEFRHKPADERRETAEYSYDSSIASHMFNQSLFRARGETFNMQSWLPGIEALSMDPDFAPAYLTVGSMEHQIGRPEEAMKLFRMLAEFPPDTEDLSELLDKAGCFLIDERDFENAVIHYEMAHTVFPNDLFLLDGYAYCLSKTGRHDDAIALFRKGVAMAPEDAELLTDLGWALAEAGKFEEAVETTEKAIHFAQPGYEKPHVNLQEIRRRMKARG